MSDVVVCATADVVPGSSKRVDVDGYRLCVVNINGDFSVVGDRCSHQDYSLSEGEVWTDACEIECPAHGSKFSLLTGRPTSLPATKPIPVYAVRVDGDDVVATLP